MMKISREGSKKFVSAVLAAELLLSAIGFSSCSKKEEKSEVEETTIETVVEEENTDYFEKTVELVKNLNLDLSDETINDATIVLLIDLLAKRDEKGKISADNISKYKTIFDADAMLEKYDDLLDGVEGEFLKGNFISISEVLPDELSKDKAILKAIESIAKEALDNKDDKDVVCESFIKMYNLFVNEEKVNDFEIRQLSYTMRAVAYSYARGVAFLARNYVSDEDYAKIDKRTNDQSSRSELKITLEVLENDFVESSDGKSKEIFESIYKGLHDTLLARVKSESDVQRKLINYLNIKYLFNKVPTQERNEILGLYSEDDIKDVMTLIDAITLYNGETYEKNSSTDKLIPLSSFLLDDSENDIKALNYVSMSSMELLSTMGNETTYDELESNPYYNLLCACIVEQTEYKCYDKDGNEVIITFNWPEMSDGVKLACFETINYTFGKMNEKIKGNSIFVSYQEVLNDMLFREVQFFQDTLDECKKLDANEYVKTK